MSGLVEDGVIVAKLPWLRIGAIALPDPLFCGPTLATTLGLETSLRALVAAWAGSYCPAVAVPLSSTITLILWGTEGSSPSPSSGESSKLGKHKPLLRLMPT